jgi:hypothetical protein
MKKLIICALLIGCGPSYAHDRYSSWQVPATGGSCCSERVEHSDGHVTGDCSPAKAWTEGGHWMSINPDDGKPVIIPADTILQERATGGSDEGHLCWWNHAVRCFQRPQQSGM